MDSKFEHFDFHYVLAAILTMLITILYATALSTDPIAIVLFSLSLIALFMVYGVWRKQGRP